jgi:hypothetical protein
MSGVHYHLVIYWLSTKRNMTFDIIWQLQHAVYGIFTMVVCNAHAWDGHETRMQVGENMALVVSLRYQKLVYVFGNTMRLFRLEFGNGETHVMS